jgi:predicted pyridoxine 5'-phosphate oxidase superfamily flavin-nucleotide-binding protein
MNTPTLNRTLVALAQVLHRMEFGGKPVDPEQYRSVIQHLTAELEANPIDARLDALLNVAPSVAELYENLHYTHAGLCRSPLDAAVSAEREAAAAIAKARKPATAA